MTASTTVSSAAIRTAVTKAHHFIRSRQTHEGLWCDFVTLAGEAEDWVTAYVASHLSASRLSPRSQRRAVTALIGRQQTDGGWGYHHKVPSDADSTACALLFLAGATDNSSIVRKAARCLVGFQDLTSGGFGTYGNPAAILRYMGLPPSVSLAGWCEATVEVTALAGRALTRASASQRVVRAAWTFVRARQNGDGYWESYWWTSPLYATMQAVAWACERPSLPDARRVVGRAQRWVLAAQRRDGGWSSDRGARHSSPFETALAISALRPMCEGNAIITSALARGAAFLCHTQRAAGSWKSSAMLVVPPPGERRVHGTYPRWRAGDVGTGIITKDQHAVFTTATVLQALTGARTRGPRGTASSRK